MATMTQSMKDTRTNANVNGSTANGSTSTTDQLKEQAYKQFDDALSKMRAEVKMMQGKLQEYDEKFEATKTVKEQKQKATEFLNASLEEIKEALDSLSKKAHAVFIEAKEYSAETMEFLWKSFNEAVEKFRKLAIEFDEKYEVSSKVSELSKPFVARMKDYSVIVDQMKDSAVAAGKSGRSYLINAAAAIESKFSLESKFSSLDEKYKILETAKSLQQRGEDFIERQKLKEKAMDIDERLTGSKAGEYIKGGVEIVKEEFGKIQQDFDAARGKPAPAAAKKAPAKPKAK